MKKVILYAACFFITFSLAAEPGLSLKESFNKTFPNAQNIKWTDDDNGFYVSFKQNENFKKVFYNKEGDFVCSWKYSDGSDLPVNIIMKLNRKFEGSKTIGVTEFTSGDNTLYNVKLSKDQKLYSIDILSDGTITDQKKFQYQNGNNTNSN